VKVVADEEEVFEDVDSRKEKILARKQQERNASRDSRFPSAFNDYHKDVGKRSKRPELFSQPTAAAGDEDVDCADYDDDTFLTAEERKARLLASKKASRQAATSSAKVSEFAREYTASRSPRSKEREQLQAIKQTDAGNEMVELFEGDDDTFLTEEERRARILQKKQADRKAVQQQAAQVTDFDKEYGRSRSPRNSNARVDEQAPKSSAPKSSAPKSSENAAGFAYDPDYDDDTFLTADERKARILAKTKEQRDNVKPKSDFDMAYTRTRSPRSSRPQAAGSIMQSNLLDKDVVTSGNDSHQAVDPMAGMLDDDTFLSAEERKAKILAAKQAEAEAAKGGKPYDGMYENEYRAYQRKTSPRGRQRQPEPVLDLECDDDTFVSIEQRKQEALAVNRSTPNRLTPLERRRYRETGQLPTTADDLDGDGQLHEYELEFHRHSLRNRKPVVKQADKAAAQQPVPVPDTVSADLDLSDDSFLTTEDRKAKIMAEMKASRTAGYLNHDLDGDGSVSQYEEEFAGHMGRKNRQQGRGFHSQRPLSPRNRSSSPQRPANSASPAEPVSEGKTAEAVDPMAGMLDDDTFLSAEERKAKILAAKQAEAEAAKGGKPYDGMYENEYRAYQRKTSPRSRPCSPPQNGQAASPKDEVPPLDFQGLGPGFDSRRGSARSPRSTSPTPREQDNDIVQEEIRRAKYLAARETASTTAEIPKSAPSATEDSGVLEEKRRAKHLAAREMVKQQEFMSTKADVQSNEQQQQQQQQRQQQQRIEEQRRQEDARRSLDAQRRQENEVSRTLQPYSTRRTAEGAYTGYRHESPRDAAPGEAPARYPVVPSITTQHRVDTAGRLMTTPRTFNVT